ncbi:MAG TPA: VCBS repeat-containing protein, partial [Candidatus Binatia bacterium]|nr:VCBS repeat-containing protein [Candidatus Binatia bacterium]
MFGPIKHITIILFLTCALPRSDAAENKPIHWVRNAFALPESIWSVAALDANGDGKSDILAMGETKVFALTAPDWKQSILIDTKEPKMLYCVAFDADQDGDLDLAVGRYQQPWINYRQAGETAKGASEPKGPDFSVAWIENAGRERPRKPWPLHIMDRELNGIHGLWTGDVNRDGIIDLISDSIMGPSFPKSIVWFEAPPRGQNTFKRHIITKGDADGRPHYLDFADLNNDGWGDLLVGDPGGGTFTWWENPKNSDGEWIKRQIAKQNGATNIKAADVNGDGRLDVIASCGHGKGVFWFEAPNWTLHVIQADLADPHALAIGDFDHDGDLDLAVASFTAFVVRW